MVTKDPELHNFRGSDYSRDEASPATDHSVMVHIGSLRGLVGSRMEGVVAQYDTFD